LGGDESGGAAAAGGTVRCVECVAAAAETFEVHHLNPETHDPEPLSIKPKTPIPQL